ncbi:PfkB family carbohydrate kinase [Pararoseomonas sp. SCSIO 73927]|uniref:PfkB family carbohydrate kinase n=1 Tax=Pararoseomonas sp. SCSIO 73927 TaxID=3114537 RepID=UPI0030CF8BA3
MIVAGGAYREICQVPRVDQIFGSGGRAAAALGILSPGTELHTYAGRSLARDLLASMAAFGVGARITEIEEEIAFSYFHPLSSSVLSPPRPALQPSLHVAGSHVLRFGMIEGDAVVRGGSVVYDPQGADTYAGFHANGSVADRLALVLNEAEAEAATGLQGPDAARALLGGEGAEVVVIKGGAKGALVLAAGAEPAFVPAYRSDTVFKIGSGDVFSAVFAHAWAEQGLAPADAATFASAGTSGYVASQSLPVASLELPDPALALPVWKDPGRIYLAGPFFDVPQLWFIEELRELLLEGGARVFSPYHDVGTGHAPDAIARADLDGLRSADAVLAVVDGGDPGTVFEVGYAAALGMPVIALASRTPHEDLTMLHVPGVEIVGDVTTAVYKALWASMG